VSGQIQYGRADGPTSLQTLPASLPAAADECHFTTPVRFGRRKTDQVGHLRMTTAWLTFQGTVDLRMPWAEIASVQHAGREVIVAIHNSRRRFHFCCQGHDEAMRGAAVARQLAEIAQATPFQTV
jgi:hypothetical protein